MSFLRPVEMFKISISHIDMNIAQRMLLYSCILYANEETPNASVMLSIHRPASNVPRPFHLS